MTWTTDGRRGVPVSRRDWLKLSAAGAAAGLTSASAAEKAVRPPELAFSRGKDFLQLGIGPRTLFRYQLTPPATGGPKSESACYFHPFATPAGTVVTEVGPEDHPHHRGIFLGWVQVEGGGLKGDFWGWGEPAPTAGRRIVHQKLESVVAMFGSARFRALNAWQVEGKTLLREDLRISSGDELGATYLNVVVGYTADVEVTLARWAFGGFALRAPKAGQAVPLGPDGVVKRAPVKHTDPASNWPDAPWYGLHLKLPEGREATVAVAHRNTNPATSWHVAPEIGLLNPSITGPAKVTLSPGETLVLRYRVLAFDGPPKLDLLNRLGQAWHRGEAAV